MGSINQTFIRVKSLRVTRSLPGGSKTAPLSAAVFVVVGNLGGERKSTIGARVFTGVTYSHFGSVFRFRLI